MTEKNKNIRNFPNSRNLPKLRFSEFIEEWEVKELREVCEINPKNSTLPNSFIYIDLESVINGVLMKENQLFSVNAPSRAQRILKKNDILFQMVRPYQKNNFFFHLDGNYVASTGYAQIRTQQDSQYIFQYLHNQKFVDKVIDRCTGTSYPAINSTDLSKIPIFITSIQEQQKISSFLKLTDCRIATQKKIISHLETLMKNSQENIFNQKLKLKKENGNNFPEWKIIKLGDLLIESKEKSKEKNQYRIISSTAKGLFYQDDYFTRDIASQDNTGYKILKKNQLVFSPQNLWLGNINVNSDFEVGLVSPSYKIFNFDEILASAYFCKYYLKTSAMLFEFGQSSIQGASVVRRNLDLNIFFNIQIQIPSIDEQTKIANFLSAIAEKIEIEKKILAQYETQKKYLLANLFI